MTKTKEQLTAALEGRIAKEAKTLAVWELWWAPKGLNIEDYYVFASAQRRIVALERALAEVAA